MTTVTSTDGSPRQPVALVGDSVAGNWWEALSVIATREHWKLVTELHATCAFTATPAIAPGRGGPYPACTSWGHAVLRDLVTTVKPQLVVTSSMATEDAFGYPHGTSASRAALGAGEAAYWTRLRAHGIHVVAIRETPDPGINAPACVGQYGTGSARCDAAPSRAITPDPPTFYAAKMTGGTVPVIDMNDLICMPHGCPSEIGNVLVYFDDHHFTQAYSQTLAPFLKKRLLATSAVRSRDRGPGPRGSDTTGDRDR